MRLLAARLGEQGGEVGMAVWEEHHGLAVDQSIVDGQGAHRFRDSRNLSLSLNRAPRRLHTATSSPCFRARIRNPSCFTSCSQPGPAGGLATRVG
jgi:hypothetical protein